MLVMVLLQVVLRWNIQRGIAVIPKSVTPSRIQANFQVITADALSCWLLMCQSHTLLIAMQDISLWWLLQLDLYITCYLFYILLVFFQLTDFSLTDEDMESLHSFDGAHHRACGLAWYDLLTVTTNCHDILMF